MIASRGSQAVRYGQILLGKQDLLGGIRRALTARAASGGADVVAGAILAQREALRMRVYPLKNQLANQTDEPRMASDQAGTDHVDPQLLAQPADFDVQVENDFHVFRQEADWNQHEILDRLGPMPLTDQIPHVRFQPRLRGRAAATLPSERPILSSETLGNESARLTKLLLVVASPGHGDRQTVGGVDQSGGIAAIGRNLAERRQHSIDHRFDEAGMVIEDPQLVDAGSVRPHGIAGCLDIFQVLPTTGIGGIRGSNQRQRPANAVIGHLPNGVLQKGVPITVSPVDGQIGPVLVQFADDGRQQSPVLGVDRADPAEQIIVLGDLQHALSGHILAAKHVFQKGENIVRLFGAAERKEQQSIVGDILHSDDPPLERTKPLLGQKLTPTGFEPVLQG